MESHLNVSMFGYWIPACLGMTGAWILSTEYLLHLIDELEDTCIGDRVEDELSVLLWGEYTLILHLTEELWELRLSYIAVFFEVSYGLRSFSELAEDEESLGMCEELEEVCYLLSFLFDEWIIHIFYISSIILSLHNIMSNLIRFSLRRQPLHHRYYPCHPLWRVVTRWVSWLRHIPYLMQVYLSVGIAPYLHRVYIHPVGHIEWWYYLSV